MRNLSLCLLQYKILMEFFDENSFFLQDVDNKYVANQDDIRHNNIATNEEDGKEESKETKNAGNIEYRSCEKNAQEHGKMVYYQNIVCIS